MKHDEILNINSPIPRHANGSAVRVARLGVAFRIVWGIDGNNAILESVCLDYKEYDKRLIFKYFPLSEMLRLAEIRINVISERGITMPTEVYTSTNFYKELS